MQAPTHLLTGVLINKLFQWKRYRAVAFVLMAVCCFLSHGLLDALDRFTYHPADAAITDPFWVGYHLLVALVSIVFLYLWWSEFKWGIIFALLPDFDWIIVHGQRLAGVEVPFYNTPHMHNALQLLFSFIPFDQLQDWRLQPVAALIEVALVGLLLLVIRGIFNQRRNIHF